MIDNFAFRGIKIPVYTRDDVVWEKHNRRFIGSNGKINPIICASDQINELTKEYIPNNYHLDGFCAFAVRSDRSLRVFLQYKAFRGLYLMFKPIDGGLAIDPKIGIIPYYALAMAYEDRACTIPRKNMDLYWDDRHKCVVNNA